MKAVLNFDGVARGRDLAAYTHGWDELAEAVETVAERFDHPFDPVPEVGPHSDHWPYVVRGIPGYHVYAGNFDGSAEAIDRLREFERDEISRPSRTRPNCSTRRFPS